MMKGVRFAATSLGVVVVIQLTSACSDFGARVNSSGVWVAPVSEPLESTSGRDGSQSEDQVRRVQIAPTVPDPSVKVTPLVPFADGAVGAATAPRPSGAHWVLLENGSVLMSSPDGESRRWNATEQNWDRALVHAEASRYDQFFDFQDAGFLAFKGEELTYYVAASNNLGSLSLAGTVPVDGPELTLVGPGYAVFHQPASGQDTGSTVYLVRFGRDEPRLRVFADVPGGGKQVLPCAAGCDFWSTNGSAFYKGTEVGEKIEWTQIGLSLRPLVAATASDSALSESEGFGEGPVIFRSVQGFLRWGDDGVPNFLPVLAESDRGEVWVSQSAGAGEAAEGWERIRPLAMKHCVPCHKHDGFENLSVWEETASTMLSRMDPVRLAELPGSLALMPLSTSSFSEGFGEAERAVMLEWLEGMADGGKGRTVPGAGGLEPDADPTPLQGDLLSLFNAHCAACHGDKGNLEWFARSAGRRETVMGRIERGEMPPAGLSPAQIESFRAAIPMVP